MNTHWKTGLITLTVSSCLFVHGCATTTDFVTGESTYNSFTLEEDIEIGQSIKNNNLQALHQEGIRINKDEKMLANLKNIVSILASVSDLPDIPYNVSLVQEPNIINASAAPGGSIIVYEGLYRPENEFVMTNDELAAVLAHEIAHVTARHGTEEMSRKRVMSNVGLAASTILNITVGVTTGYSGLGEIAGGLFDTAYGVGSSLWFPVYSREQEMEADKISMMYLAKAGIHPQAAIDIWKRAAQKAKQKQNSIFASHPSDEVRYKALEAFLPDAMVLFHQRRSKDAVE